MGFENLMIVLVIRSLIGGRHEGKPNQREMLFDKGFKVKFEKVEFVSRRIRTTWSEKFSGKKAYNTFLP